MSEELKDIEAPEVPETEEPEVIEEEPVAHQDNTLEENLKSLREGKAQETERAIRAEYERDQMAQYLENVQKQMGMPQQQVQEPGIAEDDFIEGKNFNPLKKSVAQLKKETEDWRLQQEESLAELKLNTEFSDFETVVTQEKVKAYLKKHPEMTPAIVSNAPLYSRGKAAYNLLKNHEAKQKKHKDNNALAQSNITKPKPSTSLKGQVVDGPLGKANAFGRDYSQSRMDRLRQEMDDAISNQ